ncbi:hypothetical protein [Persicobacter diffluens]
MAGIEGKNMLLPGDLHNQVLICGEVSRGHSSRWDLSRHLYG